MNINDLVLQKLSAANAEIAALRATLATPEVYAGIVTEECERHWAGLIKAKDAEIVNLKAHGALSPENPNQNPRDPHGYRCSESEVCKNDSVGYRDGKPYCKNHLALPAEQDAVAVAYTLYNSDNPLLPKRIYATLEGCSDFAADEQLWHGDNSPRRVIHLLPDGRVREIVELEETIANLRSKDADSQATIRRLSNGVANGINEAKAIRTERDSLLNERQQQLSAANAEIDTIFTRPECPYHYCSDPQICKVDGRCFYAPTDTQIDAELAAAGVDMEPAYERLQTIIKEQPRDPHGYRCSESEECKKDSVGYRDGKPYCEDHLALPAEQDAVAVAYKRNARGVIFAYGECEQDEFGDENPEWNNPRHTPRRVIHLLPDGRVKEIVELEKQVTHLEKEIGHVRGYEYLALEQVDRLTAEKERDAADRQWKWKLVSVNCHGCGACGEAGDVRSLDEALFSQGWKRLKGAGDALWWYCPACAAKAKEQEKKT